MRQSSSPDFSDPNADVAAPGESGTSAHTTVLPETTVLQGDDRRGRRRFGRGKRDADLVAAPMPRSEVAVEPVQAPASHTAVGRERPAAVRGPEEVILRLRRHGRHLFLPVFMLVAIAALAGFYVGSFSEAWQNLLAGGGALALAVLFGLMPILGWLNRRVIVTSERVIASRGVLVRTRSDVSLSRVREIRTQQHLGQRMWGSGDLLLFVGAETRKYQDLPDIEQVRRAVQVLSEESFASADQIAAPQSIGNTPKSFFD